MLICHKVMVLGWYFGQLLERSILTTVPHDWCLKYAAQETCWYKKLTPRYCFLAWRRWQPARLKIKWKTSVHTHRGTLYWWACYWHLSMAFWGLYTFLQLTFLPLSYHFLADVIMAFLRTAHFLQLDYFGLDCYDMLVWGFS